MFLIFPEWHWKEGKDLKGKEAFQHLNSDNRKQNGFLKLVRSNSTDLMAFHVFERLIYTTTENEKKRKGKALDYKSEWKEEKHIFFFSVLETGNILAFYRCRFKISEMQRKNRKVFGMNLNQEAIKGNLPLWMSLVMIGDLSVMLP